MQRNFFFWVLYALLKCHITSFCYYHLRYGVRYVSKSYCGEDILINLFSKAANEKGLCETSDACVTQQLYKEANSHAELSHRLDHMICLWSLVSFLENILTSIDVDRIEMDHLLHS